MGGLDMMNLEHFFRVIKLNWINRLSVTPISTRYFSTIA